MTNVDREQTKYPSHIYTVFHTLKVQDSSELYGRLFPAGVFIGRPQISFVLICYTTDQANHKDFKTALAEQHSYMDRIQANVHKAAGIQASTSSPWDGQTGCKEPHHFLKSVTDFVLYLCLSLAASPCFTICQRRESPGRSTADATAGTTHFPPHDIQRTESPSAEGSVLSAH